MLVNQATLETKITDFGFSDMFFEDSKSDKLTTVCGTLVYMAPEIIKNNGYSGRLADIWSCGVVLFFMVAGCQIMSSSV